MAMEEGTTTTVNFPQGMNPWGMNGWGTPWQQKFGMAGTGVGLGAGALGAAILALLGVRLGNLGLGGCDGVTQRDLANERLLSAKDAEIGKLEAKLYTDQQVNALRQEQTTAAATQAVFDAKLAGAVDVVRGKVAMLDGMLTPVLAPQVLAPSQAVLTQFQTAVAGKTADAPAANAGNG